MLPERKNEISGSPLTKAKKEKISTFMHDGQFMQSTIFLRQKIKFLLLRAHISHTNLSNDSKLKVKTAQDCQGKPQTLRLCCFLSGVCLVQLKL